MIDCPNSFCLVKSRVAAPQAAVGLVSMMLQCAIVNCVAQVHLTRMLRTDCFGGTRLALYVPSSS